jgi:hypothetical protein
VVKTANRLLNRFFDFFSIDGRTLMRFLLGALLLAAMAVGPPALGITISDTVGDVVVPGSPFPHLDFSSVQVTNTATDLILKLNLAGDPVATNWGKYMVGIDSAAGGDTAGNGWGRPISMSSGMDYWVGSWVDTPTNGMEVYNWTGAAWNQYATTNNLVPPLAYPTKDSSSVTLTVPLSYLGLGVGDIFFFDVYSSGGGGGDSAVDALGNPNPSILNWGDPYDTGNMVRTYLVVPEPASLALVGLAGLAMLGIARRR